MNTTGTIQSMDNGEFHSIANAGYAITLGAAASIPSTMGTVSFFDDDAHHARSSWVEGGLANSW